MNSSYLLGAVLFLNFERTDLVTIEDRFRLDGCQAECPLDTAKFSYFVQPGPAVAGQMEAPRLISVYNNSYGNRDLKPEAQ